MGPVRPGMLVKELRIADELLPQLDQALSALLDDLAATGLLDETMVVMTGEFGRTPQISTLPGSQYAGRNHSAHGLYGVVRGWRCAAWSGHWPIGRHCCLSDDAILFSG